MRMTRTEADKNRARVLRTAGEMFRASGFDGTGIAALMKAAGLTNGAFYKQFDSKDALIAEATRASLAHNAASWDRVLDGAEDPVRALTDWYLSDAHLDHRDKGCTYAALAAEAPRQPEALRQAFDEALRTSLAQLRDKAGTDPEAALRLISRLVGALILARAVADPALARQILDANRAGDGSGGQTA